MVLFKRLALSDRSLLLLLFSMLIKRNVSWVIFKISNLKRKRSIGLLQSSSTNTITVCDYYVMSHCKNIIQLKKISAYLSYAAYADLEDHYYFKA